MAGPGVTITAKGPLLAKGSRALPDGVQAALQELVEIGEQHLAQMARPNPGGVFLSVAEAGPGRASTGNYRRNLHGRMTSTTAGLIDVGAVKYGPWLESGEGRGTSTRFKGYRLFGRTKDWLNKQASEVMAKHTLRRLR